MDTFERILQLLSEQGKEHKQLYDYLGVSSQKYFDWKAGRIKSYNKYLDRIAEFFGVSVDYLLGKDEIKKRPTSEDAEQIAVYLSNPVIKELYDNLLKLTPEEQTQILKDVQDKVDLRILREQHKQGD